MNTRPNLTLSAVSTEDLHAQLRAIDIAVPLVTEGRTKEHRERFMMARFLATAAKSNRLAFPFAVVHSEKPDFLLRLAGLEVGAECVEAVPKELYQIEVLHETHYPEAMNFGQRFEPGEENRTWDEKHEVASGRRAGSAWMPATAKQNWISAMQHVVAGKAEKVRQGNYSSRSSMWLLVRDEWPNSLQFYPQQVREAAAELRHELAPLFVQPAFQAVFIESGGQLLCFEESRLTVEEVCDLWTLRLHRGCALRKVNRMQAGRRAATKVLSPTGINRPRRSRHKPATCRLTRAAA